MRLGVIPEGPIERVVMALNLAPQPLADTLLASLMARVLMAASRFEVFDALADRPLSAEAVAARCGLDPRAARHLLNALVGVAYVRFADEQYALRPVARKWLLKGSRRSLHDAMLHRYLDLALLEHTEAFLQTGEPADLHAGLTGEQWGVYQRGQHAHAVYMADTVAKKVPLRRGAAAMLDVGGSHGAYSVALCRRHRRLRSTVLDLPEAVAQAAPILAEAGLGERVVHRAGNALTDDLGEGAFDLVFMANLAHHFDDTANRALQRRVARALRPGGTSAILELIRPRSPADASQIGALTDFYFAVTSRAGTWSFAELSAWQEAAGLTPRGPITFLTAPGYGLQVATKRVDGQ